MVQCHDIIQYLVPNSERGICWVAPCHPARNTCRRYCTGHHAANVRRDLDRSVHPEKKHALLLLGVIGAAQTCGHAVTVRDGNVFRITGLSRDASEKCVWV